MCTACIEIKSQDVFADQLVDILNHGSLALMISIGHRSGLFDKMSKMTAATSSDIAEEAGLNERYVREWLGAMVTGGIIQCDEGGQYFQLPAEHAASLTRDAGADNIAVFAQYISVLGSVEDQVLDCFHKGGGVPYSEFGRFHEVMAEDSGQSVLPALFDHILPLVPGLTDRLAQGITVLDVGCGRGKALNMLANAFPKSTFYGYDLSVEAIDYAQREAAKNGSTNIRFEARDLSNFKSQQRFDLITAFDAIHDQARPDNVLAGIADALKEDGVFLMQDIGASSNIAQNIDHAIGPFLYTISCMHCMTVSLAQNGMGLGAMWGKEKAVEMLIAAGFGNVDIQTLEHDIQNYFYIVRK